MTPSTVLTTSVGGAAPESSPSLPADVRISGKRIHLRRVCIGDVNDHYLAWMNDPQVTQYLECRFRRYSHSDLEDYVRRIADDPDNLFLAIVLHESHRHIGNIKLGPIDRHHRRAAVGLLIGERDVWGRGLASEAIALVTRFAFERLRLHRLFAGHYAPNVGCLRAFAKAGYQEDGRRKDHYVYRGRFVDGITMGLVQSDWISAQASTAW